MSLHATTFEDGKHQFVLNTMSLSRTEVLYTINATSANDALKIFFEDPDSISMYVTSIYNVHTGNTHFFGMSGFRWIFVRFGLVPENFEQAKQRFDELIKECQDFIKMQPEDILGKSVIERLNRIHQASGALLVWVSRHELENEPSFSTPTTAP